MIDKSGVEFVGGSAKEFLEDLADCALGRSGVSKAFYARYVYERVRWLEQRLTQAEDVKYEHVTYGTAVTYSMDGKPIAADVQANIDAYRMKALAWSMRKVFPVAENPADPLAPTPAVR